MSSVVVTSPADTPWRDAVSASMGWWMMFTIYPKVGGGKRSKGEAVVELSDRESRRSVNDLLAG
ncbi:hypothetical protein LMG24238_03581 [Paraburkholderia sediminicola]|uniref:Uncharacterized protein n=1 Tax=Paraburkholderia sediminicola TaxID=458836 RepID=A0A6J5BD04_9BURK|nr:hypothetical protein LMG24238_03581 [Paraburkholderia sediminicola]